MTDDIIAKAAEIVGWVRGQEGAYGGSSGFGVWFPSEDRADLHALCGLLEDWTISHTLCVDINLSQRVADPRDDNFTAEIEYWTDAEVGAHLIETYNPDPLMARLEALVKLAEELE